MNFLDEFDQAFDDLFGDEQETAAQGKGKAPGTTAKTMEGEVEPSTGPTPGVDDSVAAELAELQSALADEAVVPVATVIALLDQLPRRYVLGALHGSLQRLAKLTSADRRGPANQELLAILTTRCGRIRKVLRKQEKQEILRLGHALGDPHVEEHIGPTKRLFKELMATPGLEVEEAAKLFMIGLWQPALVLKAKAEEIESFVGISPKVTRSFQARLAAS